jgi:HSP20 family protein
VCDHAVVRSRIHTIVLPSEAPEFADDLRRIFLELGRTFGLDALAGECSPPIDVFENEQAIEISMDLPGVEPGAVRVIVKSNVVLIAGEKTPRRSRGDSSFHLVERGFGRFARSVRLTTPCDASQARATLEHGELRIRLPKMADRRGCTIDVPISRP